MNLQLELNEHLEKLAQKFDAARLDKALHTVGDHLKKEWGFVHALADEKEQQRIRVIAHQLRARFKTLVVLGIGGSSLGGQTIARAFHHHDTRHRLLFLDNIDPEMFCAEVEGLDWKTTAVFLVSKSGNTIETWAQWQYLQPRLQEQAGKTWAEHVVCCTDPHKSDLLSYAQKNNLQTLSIPPNVGGRFTVLTGVGLLPAEFFGLNSRPFLEGAQALGDASKWKLTEPGPGKLVAHLARATFAAHEAGFETHVMMSYAHPLDRFCDWFVQLWAESLGKEKNGQGVGSTPLKAVGVTDQHSQMQLFMQGPNTKLVGFLWNKQPDRLGELRTSLDGVHTTKPLENKSLRHLLQCEFMATRQALQEAARPTYTVSMPGITPTSLGQLFLLYEAVTVVFGTLLGVNPVDQPGVERAKILTKERLINT